MLLVSPDFLQAISTSLIPSSDNTFDIGDASYRWRNLHLAGSILWSDVNLYRSAADVLKTDDNFDCLALRIGGIEVIDLDRNLKNIYIPPLPAFLSELILNYTYTVKENTAIVFLWGQIVVEDGGALVVDGAIGV